jgi:hypothetical protein
MNPDKMHFHHVLNQHINNHIFVVIILSGLQVISSTIGILIFYYKMYALGWVLMGVLISVTSTYTIINGARIRKIERSNTQELNK